MYRYLTKSYLARKMADCEALSLRDGINLAKFTLLTRY
jgi:hypothetical protein